MDSLVRRIGRPDDVGHDGVHLRSRPSFVGNHCALAKSVTIRSETSKTSVRRWLMRMTAIFVAKLADKLEHMVHFADGKRRRRLVHDDEPAER